MNLHSLVDCNQIWKLASQRNQVFIDLLEGKKEYAVFQLNFHI